MPKAGALARKRAAPDDAEAPARFDAAVSNRRAPSLRRPPRGPRLLAFAIAAMLQLGLILLLFNTAPVMKRQGEQKVEVVLLQTPEKPPEPPPLPIPPPLSPPPAPIVPPLPQIEIAPAKQPRPAPLPIPRAASAEPTAVTPLPPPPPAPSATEDSSYNAAVRAAVFAAHHVPPAARLMALFGDVRVSFALLDGAVGAIRLVASSGHDVLDAAALAAVREARYPPVPDALRGRTLAFEITLYHRRGEP